MYAFTHIYMKFMRYSKYIIIIEKEQLTITHYTNPNFMWYYFYLQYSWLKNGVL